MKKLILSCAVILHVISLFSSNNLTQTGTVIKIGAVGDLVMHIPVKLSAKMHNIIDNTGKSKNNRGFDYLFSDTKKVLKKHDAVIANMEFPIVKPYRSRAFNFNCRPEIVPSLLKNGINIVTFANNHSYDKGRKGVIKTLNTLRKYKMKYIGAGRNEAEARHGVILSKDNLKIGLIAYTGVFNIRRNSRNTNKPRVNDFFDSSKVIEDIKRIKSKVDFLILVVHWGVEYKVSPRQKERKYAQKYIENGVDMIIGHHPHVLQYIEKYKANDGRNCLIAYSLGNFISNQAYYYSPGKPVHKGRERDGVIMSIVIEKKKKFGLYYSNENKFSTYLKKVIFYPTWTVNQRLRKNGRFLINIKTVLINNLILKINEKIKNTYGRKKRYYKRRKKMLINRLKEIRRILFKKEMPAGVEINTPGINS